MVALWGISYQVFLFESWKMQYRNFKACLLMELYENGQLLYAWQFLRLRCNIFSSSIKLKTYNCIEVIKKDIIFFFFVGPCNQV